jgi:hypothetical protein
MLNSQQMKTVRLGTLDRYFTIERIFEENLLSVSALAIDSHKRLHFVDSLLQKLISIDLETQKVVGVETTINKRYGSIKSPDLIAVNDELQAVAVGNYEYVNPFCFEDINLDDEPAPPIEHVKSPVPSPIIDVAPAGKNGFIFLSQFYEKMRTNLWWIPIIERKGERRRLVLWDYNHVIPMPMLTYDQGRFIPKRIETHGSYLYALYGNFLIRYTVRFNREKRRAELIDYIRIGDANFPQFPFTDIDFNIEPATGEIWVWYMDRRRKIKTQRIFPFFRTARARTEAEGEESEFETRYFLGAFSPEGRRLVDKDYEIPREQKVAVRTFDNLTYVAMCDVRGNIVRVYTVERISY